MGQRAFPPHASRQGLLARGGEAQEKSCAAWTLAVLRQKTENQERAPFATVAATNSMAAAYSKALQAQKHACTAP